LAFILMVILSALLANRWPAESQAWYLASTVGRLVSIAILLAVLAHLGWLHAAGFTRSGLWQTWLLMLPPLVYTIMVSAYAMTGNFDFRITDPVLAGAAALFIMTAAFHEEVAFRGLILHAFVRAWGDTSRGLNLSVLVSALLFGGMHIVNVLGGAPLPEVLLQCVVAFFLGIFLGALVLRSKSIYPAAAFHGLLNLAGYLNLTANGAEGSVSSWLILSALMVPLAVLGMFLLRSVPQRPAVLEPA
jgi:membrane protease YdiL (CAAX protease family)